MDLLRNFVSLLDEFVSHKSSAKSGNNVANKGDVQDLFQRLKQVAGYENQLELANCAANNPKWIELIVSFAVQVFEGTNCMF